jgi:hypothetical protein
MQVICKCLLCLEYYSEIYNKKSATKYKIYQKKDYNNIWNENLGANEVNSMWSRIPVRLKSIAGSVTSRFLNHTHI